MSDHAAMKGVLHNTEPRESMDPYQSLWMAHWKQTRPGPRSRVRQGKVILHDEKHARDHETKQKQELTQTTAFGDFKRLDVGMGCGDGSGYKNKLKQGGGGFEILSAVLQTTKEMVTVTGGMDMRNKSQVSISSDTKSAQSKSVSVGKLLPFSYENFSIPYLESASLEQEKLQKFDLNEKMERMLSPGSVIALGDGFKRQLDDRFKFVATDKGTSMPHIQQKPFTTPFKGIHLEESGQGTVEEKPKQGYANEKILHFLKPLHDDHAQSDFNSKLFKFKGSHGVIREIQSGSRLKEVEPENFDSQSYSACFASERKLDSKLLGGPGSQYSRQKDEAVNLNDTLESNDFFSAIIPSEQGNKLENACVTGFLPSRNNGRETSKDLEFQKHVLHRMPMCCFHDMATLRMRTMVDSVEGLPGGPTRFSKTTHHVFITKKFDLDLAKGEKVLKESKLSTEPIGGSFHKFLGLPPSFGCCNEQVEKLPLLREPSVSEDKEDRHTMMTSAQNESSAETDSMPMDFTLSNNASAGIIFSPSHKDVLVGNKAGKSLEAVALKNKGIGIRTKTTELPDMNEENPSDSAVAGSIDARESSISRTESLDVEHLLSHVEQPETPNSGFQPSNPPDQEPGSRWVKRLKLSASDSHALGTKSLGMGDTSSSEKVNNLFNRIKSFSRANSEPILSRYPGKGIKHFDNKTTVLKNMESSGSSSQNIQGSKVSYPWIQRWCRAQDASAHARPTSKVAGELENSKFSVQDQEKKQFPSIAAMALMGKAVTSFRPCEFKKTGSLVSWSS